MNQVEQAHQSLKRLLLNGRILFNGLPLTANETLGMIQSEQMLYEKALQFDAAKKKEKNPNPKKK